MKSAGYGYMLGDGSTRDADQIQISSCDHHAYLLGMLGPLPASCHLPDELVWRVGRSSAQKRQEGRAATTDAPRCLSRGTAPPSP